MFQQELLCYCLCWLRSRRWLRLFTAGSASFSLPLAMIVLILYGTFMDRPKLARQYLRLVDDAVTSAFEANGQAEVSSARLPSSPPELDIPLRRIVQLGNRNERFVFLVADKVALRGRNSMARSMMRTIETVNNQEFTPARAWLRIHR